MAGKSRKAWHTDGNTDLLRSSVQLFVQLFKRKGERHQGNVPWPLSPIGLTKNDTPRPCCRGPGAAHPAQAREEEEPHAAQVWPLEEKAGDWPPGLCPTIMLAWSMFLPRGSFRPRVLSAPGSSPPQNPLRPRVLSALGSSLSHCPLGTRLHLPAGPSPAAPASPAHSNLVSSHSVRAGWVVVDVFHHLSP